jgi:mono/diheme cytochrome c family protein
MCLALCSAKSQAANSDTSARPSNALITPVSGESWLNHLHRPFGDSSMGKTGQLGPPAPDGTASTARWQLGMPTSSGQTAPMRGQDLFRLNCQGCHGEAGLGAAPEIHSVIDPVRATSVSILVDRMKQRGMDLSRSAATEMAKQAQGALVQRLHDGGQDMPSFSHLNDAEVRAVLEYLKQLAGVPGAKQVAVTETPARVGELIAKSTCHVCHDATGANPTPQQLENGAIPPLETLTERTDESEFIRKVTTGAPIVMGTPPTPHRGRMPVFSYLTREEAADVYLYLSNYPPSAVEAVVPVAASTQPDSDPPQTPPSGPVPPGTPTATTAAPDLAPRTALPDWFAFLSVAAVGAFVLSLLVAGFGFAAYELRRLGRDGERRDVRSRPDERRKVVSRKGAAVEHEIGELVAG